MELCLQGSSLTPPAGSVTMAKSVLFSVPQFPPCEMEIVIVTT